jgi:hypothetical protein
MQWLARSQLDVHVRSQFILTSLWARNVLLPYSMDQSGFLDITLARPDTIELMARFGLDIYFHSIRRIFTAASILLS